MLSWTIGEITVTAVVEGEFAFPGEAFFPGATKAEVDAVGWAAPFRAENGDLKLAIQALLVKTPTRRILVDACMGNDKTRGRGGGHMLKTDLLDRLEAQGFGRDDVDTVLCTHLHVDHVGWNTMLVDGVWVPTFRKARYVMGRTEFEFWRGRAEGDDGQIFADSVQPVFDAGLVDLVEPDHVICDEIRFVPTHGHTPGHVSVAIQSDGQRALITGDIMHSPVQIARPDWGAFVDEDSAAAEVTRKRVLAESVDQPVLIIGTHFPAPTAGHIVREGAAYRLKS